MAFRLQASESPDVGNTSLSKTSEETEELLEPPEHAASNMLVINARANRDMLTFVQYKDLQFTIQISEVN